MTSSEYKTGNENDFIEYIFSKQPQNKNTIKLELGGPNNDCDIGLHIFKQLLQIFTDSVLFLYSNNKKKIDVNELSSDNFSTLNKYFNSFGYELILNIYNSENFENKIDYFKNHYLITKETLLKDFYYQIPSVNNIGEQLIYRISFRFIQ